MARPSRTGGKKSEAKARNASPAKGRKTTKTKPRIAPAATRVKRRPASDPSKDLKEAREQQAATAEILKVIASSPYDVQPVFDAIASSSKQLIGGIAAVVYRFVDGIGHLAAFTPVSTAADAALKATFPQPIANVYFFQSAQAGEVVQVSDTEAHGNKRQKQVARARGFRSVLFAPLMSKGASIGVIAVNRKDPGPFSAHHVQLLQTFANQAVIAIENTRLFDEVQAKTRDLTESLQQQTATADVLKVISRSAFDLETVLDALLSSACRLCEADIGTIRYKESGEFRLAATFGCPPEWIEHFQRYSTKPDRSSVFGRTIAEGRIVHIPDLLADPDYKRPEAQKLMGFKAALGVPLAREGEAFGVINLFRFNVSSFEDRQIELVQTFADQAVIAIENARLFEEVQAKTRDLTEALTYQTGSSNILKVIASSPTDINPVFQAIVESACELCDAYDAVLRLKRGDNLCFSAHHGPISTFTHERPINRDWSAGRAVIDQKPIQIADLLSPEGNEFPEAREIALQQKHRTVLSVPLLCEGECLGAITLRRKEVHPFSDKQIALLQTFADQAVIAIENARLFNETKEALERQTATADILKVIASSPSDVQPVFEAIAESAKRLLGSHTAVVTRVIDGVVHFAAGTAENEAALHGVQGLLPYPLSSTRIHARVARTGELAVNTDADASDLPQNIKEFARAIGWRSMLVVPMLRNGIAIGTIGITRREAGSFDDKTIGLLKTFADQAVIAIENTRLFNETQEALERQTATAEILNVIARSPSDVQPVFDAIAASGHRLLGGLSTSVMSIVDDMLHLSAFTPTNPSADAALQALFPRPLSREIWNTRIRNGETVEIPDVETDPMVPEGLRATWRTRGFRSLLLVPLMRSKMTIGMINATRKQPGAFAPHHVQLLQTFADQAVIAIENVRLFDEVQAKTRDLSEALTYQTGSGNILSVIASSPTDVEPVLQAIVESACQLCDAYDAVVLLKDGDSLRCSAHHGPIPFPTEKWPINRNWAAGRAFLDQKPVHVRDLLSEEGDDFADGRELARRMGHRTTLVVPLLREGASIGVVGLRRNEVHPFSDKQIALLQTFADQAVIAIGNVRLFDEVQAKTRDLEEALQYQTGSANILNVIASSVTDVQPVMNAIVESACELCGAYDAVALLREGDDLLFSAHHGPIPMRSQKRSINRRWTAGRAFIDKKPIHVHDLQAEWDEFPEGVEMARDMGHRSIVSVPLLRESESIGALVLRRKEVNPFSEKQIALLQTFADQAVIAIENVRLFNETQEALERQTATADILKVIASSPDDVQPVFAAIAERSNRLVDGLSTAVYSIVDDTMHLMAFTRTSPEADAALQRSFPRPLSEATGSDRIRKGETVEIADADVAWAEQPNLRELAQLRGFRSLLLIPLLRDGATIGMISVTRAEAGTFAAHHVQLLQTFADQAVIAIGNVRLFEEVQTKTRDLTESLEQQTATSEVLEVISSSPGELEPVFQKMLENATRVCGANFGVMHLWNGDNLTVAADYNMPPAYRGLRQGVQVHPHPDSGLASVIRTHQVAQIDDMRTSPAYIAGADHAVRIVEIAGARSIVVVPMLKESELIGAITIYRQEVRPFTDKQVALVENFTKQAVIAIENTRLLRELRARTDDLSESLEQQTATSEVLQVISSTPGDLEPVFKSMLENATRICGADFGLMNLYEEGNFRPVANYHVPAAYAAYLVTQTPFQPHQQSGLGTVARTHHVLHVSDIRTLPAYLEGDPSVVAITDLAGARSYFVVPMLKENELIGAITIYRQEVKPFAEKQTEVVANFASQAVIAIENARLLNELRERTTQLSLSLEELRTAQDRLIQTEKLASLGQLTAGIAHEIKNPLNFVNNFSALSAELTDELNNTLKPVPMDVKVREEVGELTGMIKDNLQKVVQHGKRADSIVKNMLLHSREGSREHRPADINTLLDESLNLAYHGARAEKGEFNITLQRDFDADAGTIEVFPQEITRAFLNLIANGVYAATRRKTEDKEPGFEPTLRATTKNLGTTVEIRIRDNGTGIPAEVQQKMFNPFFTTKPAGEGTGLGLSMTHDIIVKQHGGRIDVATEAGQFTEFTIVLPRHLSGRDRGET